VNSQATPWKEAVINHPWIIRLKAVVCIAEKDARLYFFKGPNLTFGILLPLVLYWAFAVGRDIELSVVIPGLIAMAVLFGAGAVQSISLPLERRTGTLYALLTAPITTPMVVLGKVLAGVLFGLVLSLIYLIFVLLFLKLEINITLFFLACIVSSCCFSAFGLLLATPFHDIPQAMPPATVVRIAIVFLSSTFMPIESMSTVSRFVAQVLPITYAADALRQAMNGALSAGSFALDLVVLTVYGVAFLWAAVRLLGRDDT